MRDPGVRDAAQAPSVCAVTPCMGRLRFVRETLQRVLEHPEARCCLVDYSCPDRVGDWVEQHHDRQVQERRILIERVTGEKFFNKSRAHNAGARRALHDGAEYLCFLDADTLVEREFWEFVQQHVRPDRFLMAAPQQGGISVPSLTGLLVVHAAAFERAGGYDEGFVGWGGEDIEFRLRLHLVEGLDFADVPLSLVRSIPHQNSLRSKFYEERNIDRSNRRNLERIRHKLRHDWIHRLKHELSGARHLGFADMSLDHTPPKGIST